jgi:hypothetical protein
VCEKCRQSVSEETKELLRQDPSEWEPDESWKKVTKAFGHLPEDVRRKWLEEILEEHRRKP